VNTTTLQLVPKVAGFANGYHGAGKTPFEINED
jgi:hypothetical protein